MAGGSATINIIQCGYVRIVLETYGAVRLVSLYVLRNPLRGGIVRWSPLRSVSGQRTKLVYWLLVSPPSGKCFFLNIYIYMHIVFLMVFLMFMHNREMGKIGYDKMR